MTGFDDECSEDELIEEGYDMARDFMSSNNIESRMTVFQRDELAGRCQDQPGGEMMWEGCVKAMKEQGVY
jgi:hypothetical protein